MDIVTAGYPCQPFSVAGKRRGADDPRHLWPHVARIIGECAPPFVFLENVAHHLRLGFPEVATGRHSDDQITQIAASIGEFGFTSPILLGADSIIIAGHGRLLAAQQLGMTWVPTIVPGPVSDAQRAGRVVGGVAIGFAVVVPIRAGFPALRRRGRHR